MKWLIVAILFTLLMGCQVERSCPKEQSFLNAQEILKSSSDENIALKIKSCDDIDTLRIVVLAAMATAWPMDVGTNVNFDNKMEDIAIKALKRMYDIGSDYAFESIEYYKRAFCPDGAYSLFFNEMEKNRREREAQGAQQ
jgi:hypothetical protein